MTEQNNTNYHFTLDENIDAIEDAIKSVGVDVNTLANNEASNKIANARIDKTITDHVEGKLVASNFHAPDFKDENGKKVELVHTLSDEAIAKITIGSDKCTADVGTALWINDLYMQSCGNEVYTLWLHNAEERKMHTDWDTFRLTKAKKNENNFRKKFITALSPTKPRMPKTDTEKVIAPFETLLGNGTKDKRGLLATVKDLDIQNGHTVDDLANELTALVTKYFIKAKK